MPKRDGEQRADAIAEAVAQIGMDNVEVVHEVYRRFAAKVDCRALMDWSIKQPLDDLLMPVFLAAVVTITRELDLGEVRRLLSGADDFEWAVRFEGTRGTRYVPMPGEAEARAMAADPPGCPPGHAHRYTPVRRRIGPWVEAPDA